MRQYALPVISGEKNALRNTVLEIADVSSRPMSLLHMLCDLSGG